jgi:hypothetical protein
VDLYRGRWNATIFPAGEYDAVFGPATLNLQPDVTYLVFAVGSLENETFDLLVEPVAAP